MKEGIMEIKLNQNNIKNFIIKTLGYNEDIVITPIDNPNAIVNGKSLYSVLALSVPNTFYVKILSMEKDIIDKFNKDMESFR